MLGGISETDVRDFDKPAEGWDWIDKGGGATRMEAKYGIWSRPSAKIKRLGARGKRELTMDVSFIGRAMVSGCDNSVIPSQLAELTRSAERTLTTFPAGKNTAWLYTLRRSQRSARPSRFQSMPPFFESENE
jgi:hypothetical protein